MEQKKKSKKPVVYVSPVNSNDEIKDYADKLRKVSKAFDDQGYRMANKNDPIKRPDLYRLAMTLNHMSGADVAYFWDNWELDPVCVWAYKLAKFFKVPVQLETPVMDVENE